MVQACLRMLTDSRAMPKEYENLVVRKDMGKIMGCFQIMLNTFLGVKTINEAPETRQGLYHAVLVVLMITVD